MNEEINEKKVASSRTLSSVEKLQIIDAQIDDAKSSKYRGRFVQASGVLVSLFGITIISYGYSFSARKLPIYSIGTVIIGIGASMVWYGYRITDDAIERRSNLEQLRSGITIRPMLGETTGLAISLRF